MQNSGGKDTAKRDGTVRRIYQSSCKYWRHAIDFDFLADEGVIETEDRDLFWYAETATEIWDGILGWYDKAGTPLLTNNA